MNQTVIKKLDSLWTGTVIGLTAPWFSLFVFYLIRYHHITFQNFFSEIILAHNILTPVISLCAVTNLLVFFIFIWTNRNRSARGVLLATFIYCGYVIYQKNIA